MNEVFNPQELQKIIAGLLAAVDVFAGLKPLELAVLLQDAKQCRYEPGEYILTEGSEGTSLFIVYSGSVQVQKGGCEGDARELARLGPAECFGEISLIDSQRRSADIVALDHCLLLRLDEEDLWLHPAASAKIFRNIARILAHRLRETSSMKLWWEAP
jgi:CRP-like cAMP-binding protein